MKSEERKRMSKSLKILRKEMLNKYSGKMSGYEHLDDGTGDYSKEPAGLEDGTDALVSNYKNITPGEEKT
jgi:hypothetical protein